MILPKDEIENLVKLQIRPYSYIWSFKNTVTLLKRNLARQYGVDKNYEIHITEKGKIFLKYLNEYYPRAYNNTYFIAKALDKENLSVSELATAIEVTAFNVQTLLNKNKHIFKIIKGKYSVDRTFMDSYKKLLDELQYT